MGPMQAAEAVKGCLDMGADEGYLLSDRVFGGADTLATGYILSEMIKLFDYDLIICGSEAIDGCTGQVGPIIAENLGIVQFSYVSNLEIENGKIKVIRSVGKYLEHCETEEKALICVLKSTIVPRQQRKSTKEPIILTAKDLKGIDLNRTGSDGSPTRVVAVEMSDSRQKCYVSIDDSLSARERIRMIINGGIEKKEKVELIRGTSNDLAEKILNLPAVSKYI